jgi:hypothetical protein
MKIILTPFIYVAYFPPPQKTCGELISNELEEKIKLATD